MTILIQILFYMIMCIMMNSPYPCGRCYECLSRKRSDWSIRMQEQKKFTGSAFHCILTYKDEFLPRSKNGLPNVSKRDCQLFIKRLRHEFPDRKLSYFLVSEFGLRTLRPHYHVLFFNLPILPKNNIIHVLEKTWQKGEVRKRSDFVKSDAQLHYVTKDIYNWVDPLDIFNRYQSALDKQQFSDAQTIRKYYESIFSYCDSIKMFDDSEKDSLLSNFDDRDRNFRLMSKFLGYSWLLDVDYISFERQKEIVDSLDPIYITDEVKDSHGDVVVRKRIVGFRNLNYDDLQGCYVLPDEVKKVRDFFEVSQRFFNPDTRHSNDVTNRYAIPAYFRNKLFIPEFRLLLNIKSYVKHDKRRQEYFNEYEEYDSTHDVPMYIEIARNQWHQRYKYHKDKYLFNKLDYYFD